MGCCRGAGSSCLARQIAVTAKPIQFGNDMGGGYFSVQAGEGKEGWPGVYLLPHAKQGSGD